LSLHIDWLAHIKDYHFVKVETFASDFAFEFIFVTAGKLQLQDVRKLSFVDFEFSDLKSLEIQNIDVLMPIERQKPRIQIEFDFLGCLKLGSVLKFNEEVKFFDFVKGSIEVVVVNQYYSEDIFFLLENGQIVSVV